MGTRRHRGSNTLSYGSLIRKDYNPGQSSPSSVQSIGTYMNGKVQSMDDYDNKDRWPVKGNDVVLSDVYLSSEEYVSGVGGYSTPDHPIWGHIEMSGSISGIQASVSPVWFNDAFERDGALAVHLVEAYNKMNSSPLITGEGYADRKDTVRMLRKPFSDAQDLLRRMYQRKTRLVGKTATSVAKAISNTWLEYRYGWKPLILDISTIIEESRNSSIMELSKRKRPVVFRSGTTLKKFFEKDAGTSGLLYSTTWRCSCLITTTIGCGVVCLFQDRSLQGIIAKTTGLDARSLPATLWEITPYSFVVDWFVKVGPWLNAIVPDPNITVLGNWATYNTKTDLAYTHGWTHHYVNLTPAFWINYLWPNSYQHHRVYSRSVNVPIPLLPPLSVKPLSLIHQVDGAALILVQILNALKEFKH